MWWLELSKEDKMLYMDKFLFVVYLAEEKQSRASTWEKFKPIVF